ncbi:MAG: ABC transporter permease, partial [Gemmatimonadota bacterium]|nr:ABC transporter permease [Gemmatimonadota bacterium]
MKNSDTTYQNNRLARTLVSLIGVIVPANQRSIWREEWLSELECSPRPETGNARTKNVVLGTFRHALTLRLLDLETIHQDITFSIRGLFKRPVFAITGITTLGLGIGAVTAVFALVDHVLIRPLPYPDSHELYTLFETDSTAAIRLASYPTFSDWHEENDSFDGMAYVHGNMLRLVTDVGSSLLLTSFITDEFFETLGTSPVIGRVFDSEDYNTGRRVVILSHGTWQTHFAGSSNIIGSSVILSEEAYTIVGVMPPWFEFPNWGVADTDLWVPFTNLPPGDLAAANQRGFHADSRIIARLPSTTSLDKASDEMAAVARGLAELYPAEQRGWTNVEIRRLRDWVLGDSTSRITMLVAVVVLLMLITSANLVNLLLAQGASRAREFAIRKALGADRSRILRQLFIEALVLSAAGAGLGVLMAIWGVNLMQRMMPRLPRIEEVAVDGETLVFAALLGLITTILVGFLPATRFTRQDLTPALRASVGISHSAHGTG